MHPLLVEYQDCTWRAGQYCTSSCVCDCCRRMHAIERELTEALEYAALIGDIKEAVKAAEENHNGV